MLVVTENYNLLEVRIMSQPYTNGHESFKDNAKNVTMQVFHDETAENENKPLTEADHKNTGFVQKIII